MIKPELRLYTELTLQLEAKIIVELGTGFGYSTSAFIKALKKIGGLLFSIDKGSERVKFTRNMLHQSPYVMFLQGDSVEIGKEWTLGDIDILLCDSDHSYEHVKKELETWDTFNPKLIFIHDTWYNNDFTPPYKAGEEFARKHNRLFINHRFKNGLGMIYNG